MISSGMAVLLGTERGALSRAVVFVILALAAADAQIGPERRTRGVELRVRVEGGLVHPALEQRQPIGIRDALKDLELLAAGLFACLRTARLVRLRQLGALARCCGDGHHESDRHWRLLGHVSM